MSQLFKELTSSEYALRSALLLCTMVLLYFFQKVPNHWRMPRIELCKSRPTEEQVFFYGIISSKVPWTSQTQKKAWLQNTALLCARPSSQPTDEHVCWAICPWALTNPATMVLDMAAPSWPCSQEATACSWTGRRGACTPAVSMTAWYSMTSLNCCRNKLLEQGRETTLMRTAIY